MMTSGRRAKNRSRPIYLLLMGLTVAVGLASRSSLAEHLPAFISTYAGDTLWALTLFLCLGILFPRASIISIAVTTLAISFAVEISQFYQAPWINSIRDTRIGGLVLGFGFKWSDLACYAAGSLIGVCGEILGGYRRETLRGMT